MKMRNQDTFDFGADNELVNSYEQYDSPVHAYETLDNFDTPTTPIVTESGSNESYPNEIEHKAATRVLGLGYSIQGMRSKMLGGGHDSRG